MYTNNKRVATIGTTQNIGENKINRLSPCESEWCFKKRDKALLRTGKANEIKN